MYSFPNLEPDWGSMSSSNCFSWPAYRFLRRQVKWSDIPISWRILQFVVIHTVKRFGLVNKAEVDVFLELSCFFDVPVDGGNLISDSSDFSKSSLNIWKFMVHILFKPGLEDFENYFATSNEPVMNFARWTTITCLNFHLKFFKTQGFYLSMKLSVKSTIVLSTEGNMMTDVGPISSSTFMSIKIKTKENSQ